MFYFSGNRFYKREKRFPAGGAGGFAGKRGMDERPYGAGVQTVAGLTGRQAGRVSRLWRDEGCK
jgi:hypothetical protein